MLSTRQQRQGEAPEKLFLVTMIQDKPHTNLGFAAKETVFEFQLSHLFIFPYLHKPFHPLRRKISTDIRTRGDQGVGVLWRHVATSGCMKIEETAYKKRLAQFSNVKKQPYLNLRS